MSLLPPLGPDREPIPLEVHELETLGADLLNTAQIVFGEDVKDSETDWCYSIRYLDDGRTAEFAVTKVFNKQTGRFEISSYRLEICGAEDYEPNRMLELMQSSVFEYDPNKNQAACSTNFYLYDSQQESYLRISNAPNSYRGKRIKERDVIRGIISGRASKFNTVDSAELYAGLRAFGLVRY